MNPFTLFDASHLIVLAIIFVLMVCFTYMGGTGKWEKSIRWSLAALLLSAQLGSFLYLVSTGVWSWKWGLPLQICDLAVFACLIALIKPIPWIWELAYFWGLGGSFAAVLTPDLPFGFPSPVFFAFFATHGTVLVSIAYLAFGLRYPVSWNSVKRVWVITHLYALFIAIFNSLFGTNYLYLCQKSGGTSILDLLGPWPYYLLGIEVIFTFSLIAAWLLAYSDSVES